MTNIIEACKKGDRLAQKALYQQYKNTLFVMCLRYASNREDAEDILQEGFVKIFRDLYQYKYEGSLEGWMRRVVLNVALQHIKKKKQLELWDDFSHWENKWNDRPEESFDEDMIRNVLHLMQSMPPGFRTVLNLFILEEWTHEQIAKELGISVGTSKSQLNRAKKHLKELVDKSLIQ
ncbi:MAG TPA: sigma-70 family RNA polymerase sigma factor [Saprospiraceae bacterium]|nr:sigma-70 family RNA polymerase sigma factor [Saprospiraceae bacterium]HMQ84406.1 sigma-70 family RNA polymerase sigma factor [Saprospiraceae bacterium]